MNADVFVPRDNTVGRPVLEALVNANKTAKIEQILKVKVFQRRLGVQFVGSQSGSEPTTFLFSKEDSAFS